MKNGNHVKEDYQIDRQMPHSPDMERGILGSILLLNDCFFQTENLSADDFYLRSHQAIYRRMAELVDDGKPIDFLTLTECLSQHHELQEVGGVAYVTDLTNGLPRVKNIENYVAVVKDKASLRRTIIIGMDMIANAYNSCTSAEEIITEADRKLCEIQGQGTKGPRHASEVVSEIRAEFSRVRSIEKEKSAIGFSTGIPGLDKDILGYHKGEMVLIAGETSSGKSTLMRQAVFSNIFAKIPTLVFTYEVAGRSFVTNMLSPIASMSGSKLRDFREMDDQAHILGQKSEVERF